MLKNKVVLVTGAASGIGQAIALVAAREGARLVLSDIDEHAGQAVVKQVLALGAEANGRIDRLQWSQIVLVHVTHHENAMIRRDTGRRRFLPAGELT